MSGPETDRSLGFLLHDVSRLMRRRFDRRAQALGLTRSQWAVLAQLYRREGIHQAGLAELLEVEKITLARHLDRLEAAGWVERRRHPGDRRTNRLYLTDKAFPVLERLRGVAAEVRGEALAGLSHPEAEGLVDLLLRVKHNLSALEDPGRDGGPSPAGGESRAAGRAETRARRSGAR